MTQFTEEQTKMVIDEVHRVLVERSKSGALESDMDFLMGAAAVMGALEHGPDSGKLWTAMPAMWVLFPMAGRSIADHLKGTKKVEVWEGHEYDD